MVLDYFFDFSHSFCVQLQCFVPLEIQQYVSCFVSFVYFDDKKLFWTYLYVNLVFQIGFINFEILAIRPNYSWGCCWLLNFVLSLRLNLGGSVHERVKLALCEVVDCC